MDTYLRLIRQSVLLSHSVGIRVYIAVQSSKEMAVNGVICQFISSFPMEQYWSLELKKRTNSIDNHKKETYVIYIYIYTHEKRQTIKNNLTCVPV